ncbi:MAG: threonine synthase [Bacteroidaceae bacterium]|nr:threonine synthase [Bacteroidaceae bacterium]
MRYYSTNGKAPLATLEKAVVKGLAEDKGLYMPERIKPLPASFFDEIQDMTLQEIAYRVADCFFGEDVDAESLRGIVNDTLSFDIPLVKVEKLKSLKGEEECPIYSLELFYGPTLAFKDVGARFMARLLRYFTSCSSYTRYSSLTSLINVLVATSGDTGSAVANGFLGVEGIHVYVLYPKGKVSPIQECQFTTLGKNITAIEVDGVFDDCQALVKSAFMDEELNARMRLTSANSINVARFLPQSFYYFWAYAQLKKTVNSKSSNGKLVCSVPSGNFGNICSALFGKRMGLPISRFIAANNANDVFHKYIQSGKYEPKASIQTIANAMDVGAPSNFARILDLYAGSHEAICHDISSATYSDQQIAETMRQCLAETGYQLDPHGACGYRALQEGLRDGEVGFFIETAHPAKFKQTVDEICGTDIEIPERLQAFMKGTKQSIPMSKDFDDFKNYLLGK